MIDTHGEKSVKEIQEAWNPEARLWSNIDRHPLMGNSITRKNAIETELRQFDQELLSAERILDIGAGGGTHIYFPPQLSRKVVAVDLADAVLRLNPSSK